jgi:hypothetical protein
MNPSVVFDFDFEWLDEDEEDEMEPLGELYILDPATGSYAKIDSMHLSHFVALYEREDDLLN